MELINYSPEDCARQFEERPKPGEERNPFEIDRARIIHSAAFRRLQGKTQVFVSGSGDFFRTRLTHSLEAAQIGKGLALRLGAHPDLIEASCLAHDLGHPPFGHIGESALHRCMQQHGGFEGNAQNLRLLCRLSTKFIDKDGLNLTRATLDSLLKYKQPFVPGAKKFYYLEDQSLIDWISQGGSPTELSFECQIMDWADQIAYSVHDLEDGMKAGMITSRRLLTAPHVRDTIDDEHLKWMLEQVRFVEEQSGERSRKAARKELTSRLIHDFVQASDREKLPGSSAKSERYCYRVVVDPKEYARCMVLKDVMFRLIVEDARVATLENKAQRIVQQLFEIFSNLEDKNTAFLFPDDFREQWERSDSAGKIRTACDYIAGMTDDYAERIYARLFLPQAGSIHSL
jgi:dGTPase